MGSIPGPVQQFSFNCCLISNDLKSSIEDNAIIIMTFIYITLFDPFAGKDLFLFPWRIIDEDVEDVNSATHYFQVRTF